MQLLLPPRSVFPLPEVMFACVAKLNKRRGLSLGGREARPFFGIALVGSLTAVNVKLSVKTV